jgi:hypothetical protein
MIRRPGWTLDAADMLADEDGVFCCLRSGRDVSEAMRQLPRQFHLRARKGEPGRSWLFDKHERKASQ